MEQVSHSKLAVVHIHGYSFENPDKANIREIGATRLADGESLLLHTRCRPNPEKTSANRWVYKNVHFIPFECDTYEKDVPFSAAKRELVSFLAGCTTVFVKGNQAVDIVSSMLQRFCVLNLDDFDCPKSSFLELFFPYLYKGECCKYHNRKKQQHACSLVKSLLFADWLSHSDELATSLAFERNVGGEAEEDVGYLETTFCLQE